MIVDISLLDVVDSFFARSLGSLAVTLQLRRAQTVIVRVRPDVAIALGHFDLKLGPLQTALDVDEARALLDRPTHRGSHDGG